MHQAGMATGLDPYRAARKAAGSIPSLERRRADPDPPAPSASAEFKRKDEVN